MSTNPPDTPTPRTDAEEKTIFTLDGKERVVPYDFARALERELAAVTAERDAYHKRACEVADQRDKAEAERDAPACSPVIRVYRQSGPGFWAIIRWPDGRREAVQSPRTYGFHTPAEARAEARRRVANQ